VPKGPKVLVAEPMGPDVWHHFASQKSGSVSSFPNIKSGAHVAECGCIQFFGTVRAWLLVDSEFFEIGF